MNSSMFAITIEYSIVISMWCVCKSEDKHLNGSFINNNSTYENSSVLSYQNGNITKSEYSVLDKSQTFNDTVLIQNPASKSPNATSFEDRRHKGPVRIIIVGPVATVSIIIFLCIAYYFHNAQLNRKAKRLSMTLYVRSSLHLDDNINNCDALFTPKHKDAPEDDHEDSIEQLSPRRKSTISLSPPMINNFKRISSVSVDHAILSLSAPRRHSTFIL